MDSDDQNHSNQCTESRCIAGDDEKKIVCSKCKTAVHFVCTKLPTYQLKLFYTKNDRGYICVNCVNVPDEFQKLFNKQEERFLEKCQREVETCENIIKVQRQNEEKLMNAIKRLRCQKEKEDVTKLIEEKFDQLEKRLTSNLCNQENITNVPNSFAAARKGQNALPNFRKIKDRKT